MNSYTLDELYRLAREGNTDALVRLGLCYKEGKGVKEDPSAAAQCFYSAAEAGNANGAWQFAVCSEQGFGVAQDLRQAQYWYGKAAAGFYEAARLGNPEAQYMLGNCYLEGKGTEKNEESAVYWFQMSAQQDYADAEYNLGYCFLSGIGTEANEIVALKWYQEAARHGDPQMQHNLGLIYKNGYGNVPRNYGKAAEWFFRAARQGYSASKMELALIYFRNPSSEKDIAAAERLMTEAAEEGVVGAGTFLMHYYYDGDRKKRDIRKAYRWASATVRQTDDKTADLIIGNCCAKGDLFPKEEDTAYAWLSRIEDSDVLDADACYYLGKFYQEGKVAEKSYEKASYYYGLAREKGSKEALKGLSSLRAELEEMNRRQEEEAKAAAAEAASSIQEVLSGTAPSGEENLSENAGGKASAAPDMTDETAGHPAEDAAAEKPAEENAAEESEENIAAEEAAKAAPDQSEDTAAADNAEAVQKSEDLPGETAEKSAEEPSEPAAEQSEGTPVREEAVNQLAEDSAEKETADPLAVSSVTEEKTSDATGKLPAQDSFRRLQREFQKNIADTRQSRHVTQQDFIDDEIRSLEMHTRKTAEAAVRREQEAKQPAVPEEAAEELPSAGQEPTNSDDVSEAAEEVILTNDGSDAEPSSEAEKMAADESGMETALEAEDETAEEENPEEAEETEETSDAESDSEPEEMPDAEAAPEGDSETAGEENPGETEKETEAETRSEDEAAEAAADRKDTGSDSVNTEDDDAGWDFPSTFSEQLRPFGTAPSPEILEKERAAVEEAREEEKRIAAEKAEREAAEKAEREKAEREAAEKAEREKAEREAAEKAEREKAEREAAEKAEREKAEREAAEKAEREKAEREAAEKARLEREKKEQLRREKELAEKKRRQEETFQQVDDLDASMPAYGGGNRLNENDYEPDDDDAEYDEEEEEDDLLQDTYIRSLIDIGAQVTKTERPKKPVHPRKDRIAAGTAKPSGQTVSVSAGADGETSGQTRTDGTESQGSDQKPAEIKQTDSISSSTGSIDDLAGDSGLSPVPGEKMDEGVGEIYRVVRDSSGKLIRVGSAAENTESTGDIATAGDTDQAENAGETENRDAEDVENTGTREQDTIPMSDGEFKTLEQNIDREAKIAVGTEETAAESAPEESGSIALPENSSAEPQEHAVEESDFSESKDNAAEPDAVKEPAEPESEEPENTAEETDSEAEPEKSDIAAESTVKPENAAEETDAEETPENNSEVPEAEEAESTAQETDTAGAPESLSENPVAGGPQRMASEETETDEPDDDQPVGRIHWLRIILCVIAGAVVIAAAILFFTGRWPQQWRLPGSSPQQSAAAELPEGGVTSGEAEESVTEPSASAAAGETISENAVSDPASQHSAVSGVDTVLSSADSSSRKTSTASGSAGSEKETGTASGESSVRSSAAEAAAGTEGGSSEETTAEEITEESAEEERTTEAVPEGTTEETEETTEEERTTEAVPEEITEEETEETTEEERTTEPVPEETTEEETKETTEEERTTEPATEERTEEETEETTQESAPQYYGLPVWSDEAYTETQLPSSGLCYAKLGTYDEKNDVVYAGKQTDSDAVSHVAENAQGMNVISGTVYYYMENAENPAEGTVWSVPEAGGTPTLLARHVADGEPVYIMNYSIFAGGREYLIGSDPEGKIWPGVSRFLTFSPSWAYYLDESGNIVRSDYAGNKAQVISLPFTPDVVWAQVLEPYLCVYDGASDALYSVRTDTGETVAMPLEGIADMTDGLAANGNWVYGIEDGNLVRVRPNGSGLEVLTAGTEDESWTGIVYALEDYVVAVRVQDGVREEELFALSSGEILPLVQLP